MSEQIKDQANVAYCLEGLAAVAEARGDEGRSAHLIGAAEGLHEAVGAPVYGYYEPPRPTYGRTVTAVRSWMGQESFEAARASGRGMILAHAVKYALESDQATS